MTKAYIVVITIDSENNPQYMVQETAYKTKENANRAAEEIKLEGVIHPTRCHVLELNIEE